MIQSQASVVVERPLEAVFELVATRYFENQPRWEPDLVVLRQTSDGPLAVGTTGLQGMQAMGRVIDSTFAVVAYEPPRLLAIQSTGGPFQYLARYAFEPVDGGTQVTFSADLQPTGMYRFMESMIAPMVKNGATSMIQSLKQGVEDLLPHSAANPAP